MIQFKNTFNFQKYGTETFRAFLKNFEDCEIVKKRRGKNLFRFLNLPCAFDIECSSFYDVFNEKVGLMYTWQICINGICWYGRTYKEFYQMINDLHDVLKLGYTKRIVLYVHNLSYEFNALRKYLHVIDYFAIAPRKPLYVCDSRGIEFRCSYQLTGYSLEHLGNFELHKYHVQKQVGDLNYRLIRHAETNLTKKEIGYIINDVRVVTNYIQERLESGQTIANIELTKTGAVRNALSEHCIKKDGKLNKKFIDYIASNYIDSPETYYEQKEATQGGFTHSNPINTNKTFLMKNGKGVIHYDIASDYPFALVTMKCATGQPEKCDSITLKEYKSIVESGKHIVARFRFKNIDSIFVYDYYISSSRCYESECVLESNGRVVSASMIKTTITELDFDIIEKTYKWDDVEISDVLIYRSEYLPREFVEIVLEYYKKKTTLKGVKDSEIAGAETEYAVAKTRINSIFGCTITDVVRDSFEYDDELGYVSRETSVSETLEKYNKRMKRTSWYLIGGYCTSYCRNKLWNEAILPCAESYIYSDTDSIFALDSPEVRKHFEHVNETIMERLKFVSFVRNISIDSFMPETIKGVKKPLGIWECEGVTDFKTLGAKRYLTRDESGVYALTCAGLKKSAVAYIEQHGGFDFFQDGMKIPPEHSGRLTVSYIDEKRGGFITDYNGVKYHYNVRCGVHMEQSEYTLSITALFIEFLKGMMI